MSRIKSTTRRRINRIIYLAIFGVIIVSVIANTILQKPEIVTEVALPEEEALDTVTNSRIIFDPIPFSDPDIISPFRGAERWHFSTPSEMINNPTDAALQPPMDIYHRSGIQWDQLERDAGVYDFSRIDNIFREAIKSRQKVGFGLMAQYPGQQEGPEDDGAKMCYPMYLHNLMQADGVSGKDFISPIDNSFWVPNYNSEHFLSRFEALLVALSDHIEKSSFVGVSYKKALGYIDIRGFGSYGEWHMSGVINSAADYPAGRRPIAASLIRIIDAHIKAFQDVPMVANISAFDGEKLPNTLVPASVGYHALTAANKWGKLGWRRDNWGWKENYISGWLEKNYTVYKNLRFDTAIMNRWKYAPVLGEGGCGRTKRDGPCAFYDLPRQVKFYHASMVGNGNYCGENADVQGRDSMRMAWKLSGYRIILEQGILPKSLNAATVNTIQLSWKNTGVAPVYEDWEIFYELQDVKTSKAVWVQKSNFKLRGLLPQKTALKITDKLKLPSSIVSGNYRLVLKITDPANYRLPFPIAIKGRRPDGSYLLKEDMAVVATISKQKSEEPVKTN